MTSRNQSAWWRLAQEPPFRVFARALLARFSTSVRTRALWDLSSRPAYLTGVLAAADQALKQRVSAISVIEFGVAGGSGLLALQADAERVEAETGVEIRVFGFDAGPGGLPSFIGDHRDHPEEWQPGDFPMDVDALQAKLTRRTTLVLGNVKDTVPSFYAERTPPPVGFVSIDLDLYSSTRDALSLFSCDSRRMLHHVPMYFDDIDMMFVHRWAGELLAIEEFNHKTPDVKIDRWRGVRVDRPFPERPYLDKMYVAHDLRSAAGAVLTRDKGQLQIPKS